MVNSLTFVVHVEQHVHARVSKHAAVVAAEEREHALGAAELALELLLRREVALDLAPVRVGRGRLRVSAHFRHADGGPSIGSSWFFLHASPSFGGGTCFLIASRPRASARSPLGVDRGPSYDSFLNGGGNALDVSLASALIRSSRSPLMCGLLVG